MLNFSLDLFILKEQISRNNPEKFTITMVVGINNHLRFTKRDCKGGNMYGVAIRLGLVAAAAVLAGCAARDDDTSTNTDPLFRPDDPDTDVDTDADDTSPQPPDPSPYTDVQSTYDADLDGYLTEENSTQLQQDINDGYVTVDETAEEVLSRIEQGKYDCNDSPLTGFYTFPAAQQRLTMNQINDCEAGDIEIDLGEDAMTLSGTHLYAQGDISGDGHSDILVATNEGLYIFTKPQEAFGPGKSFDPSKATYTISADGSSVTYPQVKDVTGDGENDLVFVNGYLVSGGGLHMIPGPITSSLTLTSSDFSNSESVAARGWSVVKPDNLGAYFLTSDMDGYEPEVGEVVKYTGGGGIQVFPAIFEPGIHEWEDFSTTHPAYSFVGPHYTEVGSGDIPGAGDVDGDGYADLLIGDVDYNYATLIHGGTELYAQRRQVLEIDEQDNSYLPHFTSGTVHLADTDIPFNIFAGNSMEYTGNENNDAYGAGGEVSMGDVDGDGLADLAIGVVAEDANDYDDAGCGYVIFSEGYNNGTFTSGDTIILNGDVFAIGGVSTCGVGENMSIPSGASIASDSNGDGLKDLVLATVTYAKNFAQDALTLIENVGSSISLDSAEHEVSGPTGVRTGGIDFDDDGFEDVVVNDADGTDYILFGGPSE